MEKYMLRLIIYKQKIDKVRESPAGSMSLWPWPCDQKSNDVFLKCFTILHMRIKNEVSRFETFNLSYPFTFK